MYRLISQPIRFSLSELPAAPLVGFFLMLSFPRFPSQLFLLEYFQGFFYSSVTLN